MDSGKISLRYAKAIYAFAREKGEETRLYEEMKIFSEHFFSVHSLKKVLDDPTVPGKEKVKVMTTAAGVTVSDSCRSLLQLLMQNKREAYALSVALMYQEYYRKQKEIVIARLITPNQASEKMKDSLKSVILQTTHKQADFVTTEDPDIIGGFILRLEDNQLDASVKTQLYRLKNQLINSKF